MPKKMKNPTTAITPVTILNSLDLEKYIAHSTTITTAKAKPYIIMLVPFGIKTILSGVSEMVTETIMGVSKITIGDIINNRSAKTQNLLFQSV
jgi:hypothetical protein